MSVKLIPLSVVMSCSFSRPGSAPGAVMEEGDFLMVYQDFDTIMDEVFAYNIILLSLKKPK